MLRRICIVALIAVSLTSIARDTQASTTKCRSRCGAVVEYLFGGYCKGPFGHGNVSYAGHPPMHAWTECGCQLF
jgi:hypothetical protein